MQLEYKIAVQIHFQLSQAVEHIQLRACNTVDEVMQQHALLQLHVARRGRGELFLQILTAAVFRYGGLGFFDGIGQVFYSHRLEYKIHHMILDGTLRVGKIRIAGQNDDFDAGMVAGDDLGKLKTVHTGHADIADNDIRLNDRNLLERHHAVICLCGNLTAEVAPVDAVYQTLADGGFIVNDHNFQHRSFSFSGGAVMMGSVSTMLVPCPGSDLIDMP